MNDIKLKLNFEKSSFNKYRHSYSIFSDEDSDDDIKVESPLSQSDDETESESQISHLDNEKENLPDKILDEICFEMTNSLKCDNISFKMSTTTPSLSCKVHLVNSKSNYNPEVTDKCEKRLLISHDKAPNKCGGGIPKNYIKNSKFSVSSVNKGLLTNTTCITSDTKTSNSISKQSSSVCLHQRHLWNKTRTASPLQNAINGSQNFLENKEIACGTDLTYQDKMKVSYTLENTALASNNFLKVINEDNVAFRKTQDNIVNQNNTVILKKYNNEGKHSAVLSKDISPSKNKYSTCSLCMDVSSHISKQTTNNIFTISNIQSKITENGSQNFSETTESLAAKRLTPESEKEVPGISEKAKFASNGISKLNNEDENVVPNVVKQSLKFKIALFPPTSKNFVQSENTSTKFQNIKKTFTDMRDNLSVLSSASSDANVSETERQKSIAEEESKNVCLETEGINFQFQPDLIPGNISLCYERIDGKTILEFLSDNTDACKN